MASRPPSVESRLPFSLAPTKMSPTVMFLLVLALSGYGSQGALPPPVGAQVNRFLVNATYITPSCSAKYQCNSGTQDVIECSCHPYCSLFDSCCQNARPTNYAQLALKPSLYSCIAIADVTSGSMETFGSLQSTTTAVFDSVYVINQCPSGYQRNTTIRLCNQPLSASENGTLSALVTDSITGATYRNAYCALCNDVGRFVTWNAYKVCYTPQGSSSRRCSTGFVPPSSLASWLQYCQQGTVQSCPGSEKLPRRLSCLNGPTQYVYDNFNRAIYRNWNCTLCYGPPTPLWECSRGWRNKSLFISDVTSASLPTATDYRCPGRLSSAMTAAEQQFWISQCPKICAAITGGRRRK